MFTVKTLQRVKPIRFTVKPMVKRFDSPAQERAAIIAADCAAGMNYAQAVRAFDKRMKASKNAR